MNNFGENNMERLESGVNSRRSLWNNDLAIIDQDLLTFPDGSIYIGSWNNYLEFTGEGTYTLTNGRIYYGIWNPINQIGIGTVTFPGHTEQYEDFHRMNIYNGSWNNNLEFVEGSYTNVDGTSYNGVWNPDLSGKGTVTVTSTLSRGVYTGSWNNNFIVTGQGIFTLNNGIIYNGEWDPINQIGIGTINFPDGSIYTGSWDSNLEIIGEGHWSE